MTARKIIGVSALLTIIAAFLPWASFLGVSVTGWQGGDGQITAACGALGLVLAVAWRGHRRSHATVQTILGCLVVFVGVVDMTGIAAVGIYVTLFAGVAWVCGAVMAFRGGIVAVQS